LTHTHTKKNYIISIQWKPVGTKTAFDTNILQKEMTAAGPMLTRSLQHSDPFTGCLYHSELS